MPWHASDDTNADIKMNKHDQSSSEILWINKVWAKSLHNQYLRKNMYILLKKYLNSPIYLSSITPERVKEHRIYHKRINQHFDHIDRKKHSNPMISEIIRSKNNVTSPCFAIKITMLKVLKQTTLFYTFISNLFHFLH